MDETLLPKSNTKIFHRGTSVRFSDFDISDRAVKNGAELDKNKISRASFLFWLFLRLLSAKVNGARARCRESNGSRS